MSFANALSGMQAASYELDVLGNNIANTETVGFKGSNARFGDVFANALGTTGQSGMGVQSLADKTDFQPGTLTTTGRSQDVAIDGPGFFRFDHRGEAFYSRDGQLTLIPEGYLENARGARLVGYGAGGGTLQPLEISFDPMPGQPTTNMTMALNLDAGAEAVPAGSSAGSTFAARAEAYDTDGTPYDVQLAFTKVTDNEWQLAARVADGSGNWVESTDSLADLRFDANGQPVGETPRNLSFDLGGGNALAFTLDLSASTQFGNASAVREQSQDGYPRGEADEVVIEADGRVVRHYTNEQTEVMGQIALAHFASPQNLVQEGENSWREAEGSGPAQMGLPGTHEAQRGVWGSLLGEAIETSNVELNQELIDLLGAQRAYQVNSKSASVQNEMLQTAINLR
ncbi:flagellar hook protein FlgE [Billgrantia azerbaijanica]|nr:flagellar hook protein FlgE [Halomonas azerbaijanica]